MAIAYWTIFSFTFAVALNGFLRDHSTAKSNLKAWLFVVVAALIWPITLPFIISSKLRVAKIRSHSKPGFPSGINAAPATDS